MSSTPQTMTALPSSSPSPAGAAPTGMLATGAPQHLPAEHPARWTSGPGAVLEARGLRHSYGDRSATTLALDGVDLAIAPAQSLAIMGPSGCGKTTLLHILGGVLRPTSGSVLHAGRDLTGRSDAERTRLRRSSFGFVFQDDQLLPELTALENVILPRMLGGARRSAATADARSWLDRLGLQGMHDRRPGQLSGGQAQRVAIARALAGRPSVVFADEPTGALDQSTGRAVLDVLTAACHDAGASLVMVTHDPAIAASCERTIAMRDGRIAQEFTREGSAFTREGSELARGMGAVREGAWA
ncbi:ABC transporter ATP-binding protein [Brachybacterium nesterenkovii]|uniref:ABC transporter ATP-binding protein n=1 Tax=Brachybacterium nesterenkovii TaxID=47847 RepID=UPI00321A2A2B